MKTILLIFLLLGGIHMAKAQTTSEDTLTIEGVWFQQQVLDTLGNPLDSAQLRQISFNCDTLHFSTDTSKIIKAREGEPTYMNLYNRSKLPKKGLLFGNVYSFNKKYAILTLGDVGCGMAKHNYQIISQTDKEMVLKYQPENKPWTITKALPYIVHYRKMEEPSTNVSTY